MLMVAGYYCVFTPLSTLWGTALTNAGWNEYIVLFGTMLVNLTTEFLFWRLVVYKNSINTNAHCANASQAKEELRKQKEEHGMSEKKRTKDPACNSARGEGLV